MNTKGVDIILINCFVVNLCFRLISAMSIEDGKSDLFLNGSILINRFHNILDKAKYNFDIMENHNEEKEELAKIFFKEWKMIISDEYSSKDIYGNSTKKLFEMLIADVNAQDLHEYAKSVLSSASGRSINYIRVKRDIGDWFSEAYSSVKHELSKTDPETVVKRVGEGLAIARQVESLTDPYEIIVNVALAVGKYILGDIVVDKLKELWKG